MSNIEKIKQLYEAFDRDDIPTIKSFMADDVRWEHHPTGNTAQEKGIPYMRLRKGREAITGFFKDIDEDFEMHAFKLNSFLEGNAMVAVIIAYELTVKATGKKIKDEEIHLWEFGANGKITSFRHFLDTAKAISAHCC